MAQLGSALDWGSRGRRFKSCQPDHFERTVAIEQLSFFVATGVSELAQKAPFGRPETSRGMAVPVTNWPRDRPGELARGSSRYCTARDGSNCLAGIHQIYSDVWCSPDVGSIAIRNSWDLSSRRVFEPWEKMSTNGARKSNRYGIAYLLGDLSLASKPFKIIRKSLQARCF